MHLNTATKNAAIIVIAMVGLLVVACGTDERNADGGVGSAPTTLPSTGQTITQTSDDIAPGENKSVPAPIHDIAISVLAAKPPNATLIFTSGLPDSCYEFGGYELSRDGDVFTLDVHNLTAVGLGRPCMEIYKTIEHEAIIDTQVAACESYTVIANGKAEKWMQIARQLASALLEIRRQRSFQRKTRCSHRFLR